MTEFTTKIRKMKWGYSVKVFEDGEFYAEVTAPTLEQAKAEAAHYILVAENTPTSDTYQQQLNLLARWNERREIMVAPGVIAPKGWLKGEQ